MKSFTYKNYRFNFWVNILDGGFFGAALGFSSFITVLPLFVSTMTESAILIGLIPAIHSVGWQLPQLFTAKYVSQQKKFKPTVLWMTLHERLPFLGLALLAWTMKSMDIRLALVFTYTLLIWQGLGGGFTATAWQSLIGKIIPGERRGTFFGLQSAAANLLASGTAIMAGFLLESLAFPYNYAVCFFFASISMSISFAFLALAREQEKLTEEITIDQTRTWNKMLHILQQDVNMRWFLVVRLLSQVAVMAFAFYTVYAVRYLGMTEGTAGIMAAVSMFGQIIANPLMGWLGDRWSHAAVMKVGLLAATLSAICAWLAPSLGWFYLVFVLAGVANVAIWTIGLAMTLEFGTEAERPVYIGMANTLIAPATILAPLLGGWLADTAGFQATFIASAVSGAITALVMHLVLRDPRQSTRKPPEPYMENQEKSF
jgi:MFS family permease